MRTADFTYDLPEAAIAQVPAEPRDSARLLDADTLQDRVFADLPDVLETGDLVVVNRTRVRAARLQGHKQRTGGAIEVLLLDRRGATWEALVRPARRLRPGSVLEFADGVRGEITSGPDRGVARIAFDTGDADIEDLLPGLGSTPLPPYFTGTLPDPERYQTIFAKSVGSAAAPTAGLHFTPGVLAGLAGRGVEVAEIDLSVGLDTFRPISASSVEEHNIHTERFEVPEEAAAAVAKARRRGGRVVAVGTTVVRALESTAAGDGTVEPMVGDTSLFIRPGYEFRVVDALVTNFHVPGSSLVVLVAAFVGSGWRDLYATALERGYRFLSFGDAMFASRR